MDPLVMRGVASGSGLPPVLVVGIIVLAIASAIWHQRRSKDMVRDWARSNGYRIVSAERRYLRRGPFWWRSSKGQEVFYVVVQDTDGSRHGAYLRCGGFLLGTLSDEVTVEWDDQ